MADSIKVVRTRTFDKQASRLFTPHEVIEIIDLVANDPLSGAVIPGTGGIRKVRVAASGRGKRGGARVIYFHVSAPGAIYLLTVYSKAEREDLTPDDKRQWVRFVNEIKKARR
jgi:mRNA-degrading endonuclease RelE of RelBE toxin-antitoxin system